MFVVHTDTRGRYYGVTRIETLGLEKHVSKDRTVDITATYGDACETARLQGRQSYFI